MKTLSSIPAALVLLTTVSSCGNFPPGFNPLMFSVWTYTSYGLHVARRSNNAPTHEEVDQGCLSLIDFWGEYYGRPEVEEAFRFTWVEFASGDVVISPDNIAARGYSRIDTRGGVLTKTSKIANLGPKKTMSALRRELSHHVLWLAAGVPRRNHHALMCGVGFPDVDCPAPREE